MLTSLRASARSLLALRYQAEVQPLNRLFEVDKRRYLADLARENDEIDLFVETGTYRGETTRLLSEVCDRVISIEIDQALYDRAVVLFEGNPRVTVLHGNSADLLPGILAELDVPALFWLDGHFSGGITGGPKEPPILDELRAVLGHPVKNHVIIIDDARLFRGREGYPRIKDVWALLAGSGYDMIVQSDLIRIQRRDFVPEA